MNIVNKRWRHFQRFADDMSIAKDKLAKIIAKTKISDKITIGEHILVVHKKMRDKHGSLYTLSLMDADGSILRRGPVYIHKPNYRRRLLVDVLVAITLMVVTISSVVFVAVFVYDIGGIVVIQESCKIASLNIISTGTNRGFMNMIVQNDSDLDTVGVTITDPLGDVKFDDGLKSTPPSIGTPLPESEYVIPNDYYNVLSARDTLDIGERIAGNNMKKDESILLQATVHYGSHELTCVREATVQ